MGRLPAGALAGTLIGESCPCDYGNPANNAYARVKRPAAQSQYRLHAYIGLAENLAHYPYYAV